MSNSAADARPRLTPPVSERDHIQGSNTARVTLVEYGDYQCPDCLQAYPIMIDIQEHLGDKLRLVFRNFPLTAVHPNAQRAAEAAEAADAQGKFWEMHDYLFEHLAKLDDSLLFEFATEIGLDLNRFKRDLETHSFAARVKEDIESGIRSGVKGTPTFFINGIRHDGRCDLESLTASILKAAAEP
jgi:protein-disulfide isomerase